MRSRASLTFYLSIRLAKATLWPIILWLTGIEHDETGQFLTQNALAGTIDVGCADNGINVLQAIPSATEETIL